MAIRLKPPPNGRYVADWLDQKIVTTCALENLLTSVPKGSRGTVIEVRHGKGLTVEIERCNHCKVAPVLAGVSHENIQLINER